MRQNWSYLWDTNYPKYIAFEVDQKWVIGLWKRRKLTHENAKKEVIGARGHTASYIKEIDYIQAMEERMEMEQEKRAIDAQLSLGFKPFRFVPEVLLWKLQ